MTYISAHHAARIASTLRDAPDDLSGLEGDILTAETIRQWVRRRRRDWKFSGHEAEITYDFEFRPPKQSYDRTPPFDKIRTREFLDYPVLLREGQAESVVVQQPDGLQSAGNLAKEMRSISSI